MINTFERVCDYAKEHMLKRGEHAPLVFAATADQEYWLPIPKQYDVFWNSNAVGRMKALFSLGRDFAQKEYVLSTDIQHLFFVHEVWYVEQFSSGDKNLSELVPSRQPDRKEGLIVLEYLFDGSAEHHHRMQRREILRNGGVIDLGPAETSEAHSELLRSFLDGVAGQQWDERAMVKRWNTFVEKK